MGIGNSILRQPIDRFPVLIEHYNPFHARDGKFARGPGGGGKTVPPPPGGIGRMATKKLARAIEENGGFTYHPIKRNTPRAGNIVSTEPKRGLVFNTPVKDDPKGRRIVQEYVRGNIDILKANKSKYMGAWVDKSDARTYLDMNSVVRSHKEARGLADAYDQKAYWNIEEGREYRKGVDW